MDRAIHVFVAAALAVAGAASCRLSDHAEPPLAGPSALGLSLAVAASPDTLVPDGVSQSTVTITAMDEAGRPVRNVITTVDLEQVDVPIEDLGRLSARLVATSAAGVGTVTYTAPRAASRTAPDRVVGIRFTPVGTNFGLGLPKTVRIRLRGVVDGPAGSQHRLAPPL
jgi:hypothetical protein